MALSAISDDMNLFLSMRSRAASKRPTENKETQSFNALLQQAKEATGLSQGEAKTQGTKSASPSTEVPEEWRRRLLSPAIIMTLTGAGRWDSTTRPARQELMGMTRTYFDQVKEKYGCTEEYKPYLEGLSEFNPQIADAIWQEVRALMNADPKTQGLVARVEGIYPIPAKFDPATSFGSDVIGTPPL